jgi:hypothetical protein
MRSSVVRRSDGSETLLASSIPDLQLDGFPIEFKRADLEINTDSADVALRVRVIGKTQEEAGFTNARITDEEKFEKVIAVKCKFLVTGDRPVSNICYVLANQHGWFPLKKICAIQGKRRLTISFSESRVLALTSR